MAVSIHNLIAAISPDTYCDPSVRADVKKIVKQEGYLEAAKKAKIKSNEWNFYFYDAMKDPFELWGIKSPIEQHNLIYDSTTDGLERYYFWLLDFVNDAFKDVEKITDTYAISPSSAQFTDLGQRATAMQGQAMNMLGQVNTVVKSILNIIYDLKEFKLKLQPYEDYRTSTDPGKKNAALLSLKQTWLDQVDFVKRQNSAVKVMAQQFDFVTILDAFMAAKSLKDVKEMDLNDRVKRILQQRIPEFFNWISESEKALRQRYSIERKYLKSQVNTVKLYARWIRPYLQIAQKLEQKETNNASLVTAFNTMILDVSLLAKDSYDLGKEVDDGVLPRSFKSDKHRNYTPLVILEFYFRGIPFRQGQQFSIGGRTEITFTSYALHEQELKVFKEQWEKDSFGEVLKMIEGATSESLTEIQEDVDEFLKEEKEEEKKEKKTGDVNPFTSLLDVFKPQKKEKKDEKELPVPLKPDTEHEKVIRSQAIIKARDKCFNTYDTYKKAHQMPSHTSPYDPY